jgi:hypothetical protein
MRCALGRLKEQALLRIEIASPPSTHDHDYGESKYYCDDQDSIHWMCPVKMLELDLIES